MTPFVWNVEPEIFRIGSYALRWYSLLFGGGFIFAHWFLQRIWTNEGRDPTEVDRGLVLTVIGTIVGARLGHCLLYDPSHYLAHPVEILKVWEGGLASHGGFAGVFIAFWLAAKKIPRMTMREVFDRAIIPGAFIAGLIRVGNLFNSEMIGHPTDVPWAVVFAKIDQVPRHPGQLYEAIGYFACFALLSWMFFRTAAKTRPGMIFGTCLVAASTVRIAVEFLKENQSAFEAGMALNMGQLLSLPFLLVGVAMMLRATPLEVAAEATPTVVHAKRKKNAKAGAA